jgi:hypothetical protein
VVVDPKILKDYTGLAIEIAQDEAALAEKRARFERLEALLLDEPEGQPLLLASKADRQPPRIKIDKPQLPWGPEDVRPSRGIAETVEAVASLGGEASTKDVAVHLGIGGSAASIRLTRAVRAGLLRKVAFGTYGLPKPVPEPP